MFAASAGKGPVVVDVSAVGARDATMSANMEGAEDRTVASSLPDQLRCGLPVWNMPFRGAWLSQGGADH